MDGQIQTAPVFSPDGQLGDIPSEQLPAALKAGFKPGVTMKSSDGKIGVIPSDRVQDATRSGLTIVPFKQQETQHPGFWDTLASDVEGMVPHSLSDAATSAGKNLLRMSTGGVSDLPAMAANAYARYKQGHNLLYTAGAAEAEGLGANVTGMEKSADQGDVTGVAAHTAAAVAPYVLGETTKALAPADLPQKATATAKVLGASAEELPVVGKFVKAGKKLSDLNGIWRPQVEPATPAQLPAAFQPLPPRAAPVPGTAELPFRAPARPQVEPATPISVAAPSPEEEATATTPSSAVASPAGTSTVPRTLSGESALRKVLTTQPNKTLLQIARSRGINVTQEAALKPTNAVNNRLINKIIDDFSDDELDNVRSTRLEQERNQAQFRQNVGKEANQVINLQTYFPELKVTQAALKRTATAMKNAAPESSVPLASGARPQYVLPDDLENLF